MAISTSPRIRKLQVTWQHSPKSKRFGISLGWNPVLLLNSSPSLSPCPSLQTGWESALESCRVKWDGANVPGRATGIGRLLPHQHGDDVAVDEAGSWKHSLQPLHFSDGRMWEPEKSSYKPTICCSVSGLGSRQSKPSGRPCKYDEQETKNIQGHKGLHLQGRLLA